MQTSGCHFLNNFNPHQLHTSCSTGDLLGLSHSLAKIFGCDREMQPCQALCYHFNRYFCYLLSSSKVILIGSCSCAFRCALCRQSRNQREAMVLHTMEHLSFQGKCILRLSRQQLTFCFNGIYICLYVGQRLGFALAGFFDRSVQFQTSDLTLVN